MAYTTVDNPGEYFNTKLYTGNASTSHAITGVGFQPDWVWLKNRGSTDGHHMYDVVRGVTKRIRPDSSNAESTQSNGLTAFGTDGFTVSNSSGVNSNGANHVAWNWKAGTSFTNDASSTSIGTIDSTGSVSDTAGFSIVSYTGTGSNGTIKHGLSTAPSMIMVRNRSITQEWAVYHASLGATKFLELNLTGAEGTASNRWNNTSSTNSVFSVGSDASVNGSSNNIIAYCFAQKQGYSKFGSYTGNGDADGTFIYTGFSVGWVMVKRTDVANHWIILDNKRNAFNLVNNKLLANENEADEIGTGNTMDFLSNGFKLKATNAGANASGGNYIYMAFAESPFVTSTGIPTTAR